MAKSSILVIDDEDLMREYVEESLLRAGHDVTAVAGGEEGVGAMAKRAYDLVVTDLKMTPMDGIEVVKHTLSDHPGTRCIVMTAYGTIETAVQAMKDGADDYILKPFTPDELELAVERAIQRRRCAEENDYLRAVDNQDYDFDAMVGESAAMKDVYAQIKKIAASRSTVLIRGESGTGKELVARAMHYQGPRAQQPFIKVNCAALSAGLLESELFGHEKGAFAGAHERKIGRFELADTGTLLLDEVSEIPRELQPKLLRALQEREIDRVGGTTSIPVDTRIIATSNRDLEEAIETGDFREDLFFRLNVVPIELPPLRQRKEDIPQLMDHFLEHFARENGRQGLKFDAGVRKQLQVYDWPGNVRELQNAIERAVVLSGSPRITASDFSFLSASQRSPRNGGKAKARAGMTVAQMEKELILRTLESCGDNRTRAAEVLDISVRTLRNKLKEYREEAKSS
ncbi:MAG: sigma-54-dependent Fis family transcriptional regulator [Candidatus Hydrogenedentes bacterium]|nr:sigma-54-dependent Fis family transcriptional regulator [Candidatus Hydrogenedentota bacterium]